MAEIKIDPCGLSLLEVIKRYPEQVLQAIEQHNAEAQKPTINTRSNETCSCDAGKKLLCLESIVNDGIKFCTHCGRKLRAVR